LRVLLLLLVLSLNSRLSLKSLSLRLLVLLKLRRVHHLSTLSQNALLVHILEVLRRRSRHIKLVADGHVRTST
jgi:hypothetical protein